MRRVRPAPLGQLVLPTGPTTTGADRTRCPRAVRVSDDGVHPKPLRRRRIVGELRRDVYERRGGIHLPLQQVYAGPDEDLHVQVYRVGGLQTEAAVQTTPQGVVSTRTPCARVANSAGLLPAAGDRVGHRGIHRCRNVSRESRGDVLGSGRGVTAHRTDPDEQDQRDQYR